MPGYLHDGPIRGKMSSSKKFFNPFSHQRAIIMSRLVSSVMLGLSVSVLSISAVGCGGTPENTVIEDTRSQAEIDQEMEDYEKQMESAEQVTE